MPKIRKSHPPSLKAKVAVEAIKAHKTAAQIAQMFGVHPTQVGGWKKQALAGLPDIFGNGREQMRQQADADKDELYKQIGQLKVELDFLKKELASSTEDKRPWIDPAHPRLGIQQQCELLGVPRSTYYYQPQPESAENLRLMRQLDQLYMKLPFFGSRKMAVELEINRKRAQRLMRILGIEAHYPKPNLSRPAPGHEIYPYLLRGVAIERPNHVWSTDITYIPMRGGFSWREGCHKESSAITVSAMLSKTALPEQRRIHKPILGRSPKSRPSRRSTCPFSM
jgi:putative transposase